MIRKSILLFLVGILVAHGQLPNLPANRTTSVSVDSSGAVVAPTNFWTRGVTDLSNAQIDALAAKLDAIRSFPVFELRVNDVATGPFSEFEIKSSTDNFETVLYWHDTAAWSEPPQADNDPYIFIIRPDVNVRAWFRIRAGLPVSEQLLPLQNNPQRVIFIPGMIPGAEEWMFPGNTALRWSFRRKSLGAVETDSQGREVWHPIMPIQWLRQRILP